MMRCQCGRQEAVVSAGVWVDWCPDNADVACALCEEALCSHCLKDHHVCKAKPVEWESVNTTRVPVPA